MAARQPARQHRQLNHGRPEFESVCAHFRISHFAFRTSQLSKATFRFRTCSLLAGPETFPALSTALANSTSTSTSTSIALALFGSALLALLSFLASCRRSAPRQDRCRDGRQAVSGSVPGRGAETSTRQTSAPGTGTGTRTGTGTEPGIHNLTCTFHHAQFPSIHSNETVVTCYGEATEETEKLK